MLVEGQDCVEQKTFAHAQRVVVLDRAMRTTQFVRKRWLVDDGVPKVQLPQVIFANDVGYEFRCGV
jgi:hypothetical protein